MMPGSVWSLLSSRLALRDSYLASRTWQQTSFTAKRSFAQRGGRASRGGALKLSSDATVTYTRQEPYSARGPLLFCWGLSAAGFAAGAVLERRAAAAEAAVQRDVWGRPLVRRKQSPQWVQRLPQGLQSIYAEYAALPPSRRTVWWLIAPNALVFGLWQLRALQPVMYGLFTQLLPPGRPLLPTMVTAIFSHSTLAHFGFNMLALYSFGSAVCQDMGPYTFVPFYLAAGLNCSLLSHIGHRHSRLPGRSLGASGAVYGCFSAMAVWHPDARAQIIFFPFVDFKLPYLLAFAMGLDVLGIVRGWRTFGHWGHLGGALFGLAYALSHRPQDKPPDKRGLPPELQGFMFERV